MNNNITDCVERGKILILENPTAFLMYRALKSMLLNEIDDDLMATLADIPAADFEMIIRVCQNAMRRDVDDLNTEETALIIVAEHFSRLSNVSNNITTDLISTTSSELQVQLREYLEPRNIRIQQLTLSLRLHRKVAELNARLRDFVDDFNEIMVDVKELERCIKL